MATVNKIDSNITGLRYAEESVVPKVLPGSPVWWPLEPNSYNDFGGNVTTVARTPISDDRQKKKGVVTDLDASGGFNTDLTQTNIADLLQGFMFADYRKKAEVGGYGLDVFSSVATSDDSYNAASGLDVFQAKDLLYASGFTDASNNGLKKVDTVTAGTKVEVAENLVVEANPPSGAKLVKVGVHSDAGEFDVDASGSLPKITSATYDFTDLGLNPGEWIFVGGDASLNKFSTAANNGWKRVKSVAAGEIILDKSSATMVTEANTTQEVQIFIGRFLRNETGSSIKRRTYQLERTLGAKDNALPNQIQSEYLEGSVPNELVLNLATAEKLTADLSFTSMLHTLRDGATGVKAGDRPSLTETDAYNTSNDVTRVKMSIVDEASANPTALFAYITEASLTITNNVSPNKVIGVIGAADMTAGNFDVSGTMTVYFVDVAAIDAVVTNESVTLDFILAKDNKAIAIDIPLLTLGEGRATIEQDQPITLPLGFDGAKSPFGYTLGWTFFDYVPSAAQ